MEPNKEMRTQAEKKMSSISAFVSVDGTSESTKLQDQTIDLITAAQAFHWYALSVIANS